MFEKCGIWWDHRTFLDLYRVFYINRNSQESICIPAGKHKIIFLKDWTRKKEGTGLVQHWTKDGKYVLTSTFPLLTPTFIVKCIWEVTWGKTAILSYDSDCSEVNKKASFSLWPIFHHLSQALAPSLLVQSMSCHSPWKYCFQKQSLPSIPTLLCPSLCFISMELQSLPCIRDHCNILWLH